jgi:hypothetical protein
VGKERLGDVRIEKLFRLAETHATGHAGGCLPAIVRWTAAIFMR